MVKAGGSPPPLPARKPFLFNKLRDELTRKIFIAKGLRPKYCIETS